MNQQEKQTNEIRIELTDAEREFASAYGQQISQHQQAANMAGEVLRNFLTVVIRNHGQSPGLQFSLTADSRALVAQPEPSVGIVGKSTVYQEDQH